MSHAVSVYYYCWYLADPATDHAAAVLPITNYQLQCTTVPQLQAASATGTACDAGMTPLKAPTSMLHPGIVRHTTHKKQALLRASTCLHVSH